MTTKISGNLLKTLKVTGKQYDVYDGDLNGFLVRVNANGSMTYFCQYTRGKRIKIGRTNVITPINAREKAIQILNNWNQGVSPKEKKNIITEAKRIKTLNQFLDDEFLEWATIHLKSYIDIIKRIKSCFKDNLGKISLDTITPQMITAWRNKRIKKGICNNTINRDIAALRSVFKLSVELEVINPNPIDDIKQLKVDKSPKVRYLSKQEELDLRKALDNREIRIKEHRITANGWRKSRGYELYPDIPYEHFADYLKPMVLISINTGLRRGELLKLTWDMVNFEDKSITVVGNISKSGHSRYIPLNIEAMNALKIWSGQKDNKSKYIFANKNDEAFFSVKKSWHGLLDKAGISNFRWHDMRHHFASKLVMAGVDLNTVRELLGHSDIKMTLRYAHLAPEHKARAVEKLVI